MKNKFLTLDRLIVNLEYTVTMEYDGSSIFIHTIRNETIIISDDGKIFIEDDKENELLNFRQSVDLHTMWLMISGKAGNDE